MSFTKADMLYDDGKYYKWTAPADHDDPYYKSGADHTELNRTEGYEILYFINHVGQKRWTVTVSIPTYQKMERMIRYSVPANIRSHKKIEDWIVDNWSKV